MEQMVSKTRHSYSGEFKSKVVLDMLKGVETVSELSVKYGLTPTLITE